MLRRRPPLTIFVLSLLAFIPPAQADDGWYRQSGRTYEKRLPITLANPLPADRLQHPVIVSLADIAAKAPDFPGKAFVVVDPEAAPVSPCRIEAGGNDIPSQIDDMDGDRTPDELCFLADLPAKTAKTFHLYYSQNDLPAPKYPKRTQTTTFAECDANSLFAIESDRFMFRLAGLRDSPGYGFDMFGKYKEYPGYYQHLFHKKIFGRYGPTMNGDHKADTPRGRSILYPEGEPGAIGIGALFIRKNGKSIFPERSNVACRLAVDGAIRSVAELQVRGWRIGDNGYSARIRCAMYAGHPFMEYDLALAKVSGSDPGDSLCLGMMKLQNEQKEIGNGHVMLWGDRPAIRAKDIGMAMLFDPEVFIPAIEDEKQYVLPLKTMPQPDKPAKARLFLSGAWGKAGYWATKEEFFGFHRRLGPALLTPVHLEIGTVQTGTAKPQMKTLARLELFLSNPSNMKSVLPAECDLESLGLETGTGIDSVPAVDVVSLYGKKRLFIDKSIAPLRTEKVELSSSDEEPRQACDLKQAAPDGDVTVTIAKTQWLITGQGLKRVVHNGKAMELQQTPAAGTVSVLHNGSVCAIVRVGQPKAFCDYCFCKDQRVVKVVASTGFALAAKNAVSHVAKKEVGVEGCEQTQGNRWGRIASEKVFGISSVFQKQREDAAEDLRYPAEWGAMYCDEKKVGLVFCASPSAERILVSKGGRMQSDLPPGHSRQTIYLSPIEEVAQGEERWPLMSPPLVSVKTEGGFRSCEDRTGNGMEETVLVEDLNRNGLPDFVGDRWLFDTDSDDTLQMVLEFGEAEGRGRPGRQVREMRVYCDTVSGSRLHSSSLCAFWGDLPTAYPWTTYPEQRDKYDGCLGPGELEKPFSVYQDWDGDGVFFNGPVTEGGFISSVRLTDAYGGPFFTCSFVNPCVLESLDLDDDGDSDIWLFRAEKQGLADEGMHSRCNVGIVYFDLSDNNLDPVTVVNPYNGRAYWAVRYCTMQSADNGKLYQQAVLHEDGTIVGGRNWPMAGTWDVDNDGVANGHLYHETARPVMALDLENRFSASKLAEGDKKPDNLAMSGDMGGGFRPRLEHLQWVRQGWHFQKEMYPVRPFSFTLHGARLTDPRAYYAHSADQPRCEFEDRHGNKVSIRAKYLPERWHGQRLECKAWPDGQWDYWPTNNWNTFLQRSPWMCVSHFLRGWQLAHMEGAHDHVGFHAMARTEMAWADENSPDGASSYYLYYSPILNGLHYRGLDFGLQYLPDFTPGGVLYPIWGKSRTTAGMMASGKLFDYPREARQWGKMFLYYLDRSGDGYVDTYVLDGENDGYFEKRAWHDRKNDVVEVYDNGLLAAVKTKLEFPGSRLELNNYADLVAQRRRSYETDGLLWKIKIRDRGLEGGDDAAFSMVLSGDWLPRVAADAFHTKDKKDPWTDFAETGLDTLGRVISQSRIAVSALKQKYSARSLSKVDMLVVSDLAMMPDSDEVDALKAYLEGGGIVMLLAGANPSEESAPTVSLARCFDVVITDRVLSVVPRETELTKEYRASRGYLADPSRCWGPFAANLGVKDRAGTGLLKGVKQFFFDARALASGDPLVEHRGQTLMATRTVGRGTLVVIPSNLFHNKYMCMDYPLRELLCEKAGNQRLAENLVEHLLGRMMPTIQAMEAGQSTAHLHIRGRGGEIRFQVPWKRALVRLNGKAIDAQRKDGSVVILAPPGDSSIDLTHGRS